MAYSESELQDYWSNVQDGSILSNAAPNSFEDSATFSTDQTDDLQDIRDTSFMDRQAAVDFSNNYAPTVDTADSLSNQLGSVLDNDSQYIQRARTKAYESAGTRGLLNSSMAAGAAEGAAIDRGLQVAKGDVEVDTFNVGNRNQASSDMYQVASDAAGRTQDFQNQLGGEEAKYLFDKDMNNEKFDDTLEEQQRKFLYDQQLKDNEHAYDMEKDALKFTTEKSLKMLEQNSNLYNHYLTAYSEIASADISREDKDAQLSKLFQQVKWAAKNNETYEDIQITGNVPQFGISTDGSIPITPANDSGYSSIIDGGLPAGVGDVTVPSDGGILGDSGRAPSGLPPGMEDVTAPPAAATPPDQAAKEIEYSGLYANPNYSYLRNEEIYAEFPEAREIAYRVAQASEKGTNLSKLGDKDAYDIGRAITGLNAKLTQNSSQAAKDQVKAQLRKLLDDYYG